MIFPFKNFSCFKSSDLQWIIFELCWNLFSLTIPDSWDSKYLVLFLTVSTLLQLNNHKDYIRGDNSDVVPTDTQKNTVYAVAQKYGVSSLEALSIGHVHNIPTMQFFTRISGNIQSKSYVLSFAECGPGISKIIHCGILISMPY